MIEPQFDKQLREADKTALNTYHVRVGALGEIHLASALIPLQRGRRVVARSPRGIEIADVISPRRSTERGPEDEIAYRILRPISQSDELLLARLEKYKQDAIEACRRELSESGSSAMLLDVDQLLDGGTLIMHFLGEADSRAKEIADAVAKRYESIVRTDHLSELLETGCGPACGTGDGCGTACAGCSGCG